ncbi:MAG: hypothetical protein GF311_01285 [Candidatus Lokiarchaeota archaeon]|nr:hypothetical protein [Candidatus Lokiarchaeota archaeon]
MLKENDTIPEDRFIWGPHLRKKILENPRQYLLYTSNGPLLLLHLKMGNRRIPGTYIYGKAEPFNEEMEFTFQRLQNWVNLCNLKLEFAHTSGHCFKNDLKRAIEIINPKNLIPIHTEYSDEFRKIIPKSINLIRPILNDTIKL